MKQVFFVPDRGDVIWIIPSPAAGEARGARPKPRWTRRRAVVVLSPQSYNQRAGLAVLCPITAQVKGYPFEVALPRDLPVQGVILADQALSLDWRAHRAEKICALPSGAIEEALGKLRALLT